MSTPPSLAATGVAGLDAILQGGLARNHTYLVQGGPGTGKTTLGLQFLLAGRDAGERCLCIVLSETEEEIRQVAASHGFSLDGVALYSLSAAEAVARLDAQQTLFHSADVELGEVTQSLIEKIREVRPDRVLVDSVAEIRLLAETPVRYRRQVLALKQVFMECGCTSLFTDTIASESDNLHLQELVHGVIELVQTAVRYGDVRRRLQVIKMRGMRYYDGRHDFTIAAGGLQVYPRLAIPEGTGHDGWEVVESGVEALDTLLGGGLEEGTACLVQGASGTGKTTLCTLYVHSAAQRGEKSAIFLFDERPETFYLRASGMNLHIEKYVEQGLIHLHRVDAGSLSPGDFANRIREAVETHGVRIIVIDSLSGYYYGMPEEPPLITQMHEVLAYTSHHGVLGLLVTTQHGILGASLTSAMEMSYLSDSVLTLRYFEAEGELRKAISVIKKRHGPHENTIRELRISSKGIEVGEPLTAFRGVLTGVPEYLGKPSGLMSSPEAS